MSILRSDQMTAVRAVLRAAGVPPERIEAAIRSANGQGPESRTVGAQPVVIRQARVCEMLDCSRFHVRKLEKLGLLKPTDLAGLKRYPVSEVIKVAGGQL